MASSALDRRHVFLLHQSNREGNSTWKFWQKVIRKVPCVLMARKWLATQRYTARLRAVQLGMVMQRFDELGKRILQRFVCPNSTNLCASCNTWHLYFASTLPFLWTEKDDMTEAFSDILPKLDNGSQNVQSSKRAGFYDSGRRRREELQLEPCCKFL